MQVSVCCRFVTSLAKTRIKELPLPDNYMVAGMDHIKNSPKYRQPSPAATIKLAEPNDINRLSPWEVDFRQIEPGAMETRVSARSGKSLSLINISMSRTVHQTGVSPRDMLSVGVIHPGQVDTWQGTDCSSAELLSFGSADTFDGVSVAGFRGTSISIGQRYAENLADTLGLPIPMSLLTSATPKLSGSRAHLEALQKKCQEMMCGDATPMSCEDEEETAALLLLSASNGAAFTDRSSPRVQARALALALELMLANERENLTVSCICQEAGVSWRTLNRVFAEKFGIGPKSYHLRMRLNRARSEILESSENRSISDVANNWGFWHLGQFAQDYTKLFGELPSTTCASRSYDL